MEEQAIDFAVAVWREDGRWHVEKLPARAADSLDDLIATVRPHLGEGGAFGFVSMADQFFVAIRVNGVQTRVLISDISAAYDWDLAQDVADHLGIPEDVELEEGEPAGDLGILADFGMPQAEMEILCIDLDLYPEEQVSSIAARVGFADQFADVISGLPA